MITQKDFGFLAILLHQKGLLAISTHLVALPLSTSVVVIITVVAGF